MEGARRRNRVWDVISPVVFYLLIQLAAAMVVMIIAALTNPAIILEMARNGDAAIAKYTLPIVIASNLATILIMWKPFSFDEMRFGPDLRRARILTVIAAMLVAAALADITEALMSLARIDQIFPYYQETVGSVLENAHPVIMLLSTVVAAPLAEEFVFRGMVYRRARAYGGVKWGIFLSAILFGVFHMNMVQGIFAFVIGLFLAWIYERTQTLLVPILCHAAVNLWEVVVEWLVTRPGGIGATGRYVLLCFEAAIVIGGIFLLSRAKRCDTIQMLHK